jgi:hypothetical protein
VVEDKEKDDKDDLVEELSPALHQESTGDFPASVKSVILGRDFSGTNGILHTSCCRHGILAANTNAVEEEGPDVADDPTVLGDTPGSSKHEKTDEHDDGILDETEATTEPVTKDTDKYLTLAMLA